MTRLSALIVAAGRGSRVSGAERPKQYMRIGGEMLLTHTLRAFLSHADIAEVRVVIHADDTDLYRDAIRPFGERGALGPAVIGGASRQASVFCGLDALSERAPDLVLIHDAARPMVTGSMLSRLIRELGRARAAILARPLADTLKRARDAGPEGARLIEDTIARDGLWRAETPQAFRWREIHAAHAEAAAAGRNDFTDDAAIAEWAGIPVVLVDSGGENTKVTTAEDLALVERHFTSGDTCVGQGYDVHRFTTGDHVWLCGVRIAHSHGVDAHSDGDVALHALTDALLGAIADGDIGLHFRNTDPRWKDAPSDRFLAYARNLVEARGGSIRHVDVSILAEAPKIGPHRAAMRNRLGELLGLPVTRIGLKATTMERLGFIGRGEGLAALATATVRLPAAGPGR